MMVNVSLVGEGVTNYCGKVNPLYCGDTQSGHIEPTKKVSMKKDKFTSVRTRQQEDEKRDRLIRGGGDGIDCLGND